MFNKISASRRPFILTFITNDNEAEKSGGSTTDQTVANNEFLLSPGGIVGFSFSFKQTSCTT